MPTLKSRIALLVALGSLLLVSACGEPTKPVFQSFPRSADLQPPPIPKPGIDILTSDKANEDFHVAMESAARAAVLQIGRLCRWAVDNGDQLPFKCPVENATP